MPYFASRSVCIKNKNGQGQKISITTCYLMNMFVREKLQMIEALLVFIAHIKEN